mmetsp:Transcript_12361/g.28967  ORF Transcript_12361/g.28967 Transcript_12361/m.28967 type:complete len:254 (+) Transcript_12361:568-1329(+)
MGLRQAIEPSGGLSLGLGLVLIFDPHRHCELDLDILRFHGRCRPGGPVHASHAALGKLRAQHQHFAPADAVAPPPLRPCRRDRLTKAHHAAPLPQPERTGHAPAGVMRSRRTRIGLDRRHPRQIQRQLLRPVAVAVASSGFRSPRELQRLATHDRPPVSPRWAGGPRPVGQCVRDSHHHRRLGQRDRARAAELALEIDHGVGLPRVCPSRLALLKHMHPELRRELALSPRQLELLLLHLVPRFPQLSLLRCVL